MYLILKTNFRILDNYEDISFWGFGCLPGEYHINVDPTVKPIVNPTRRVHFALKKKIKAELNRMLSVEVI